ncbi:hypothetical protein [Peribacillus butanolivorans]
MVLLNHLPLMLSAVVLGTLFAFIAKVIYTHRGDIQLSILISVSFPLLFMFPVLLYKTVKKHRSLLIQQINKNEKLSELQKKEAKKIISTDSSLLYFVLKFTFSNYRQILNSLIAFNIKPDKSEGKAIQGIKSEETVKDKKEKIVIEAESALLKNYTKPLGVFLSKSLA